MSQSELLKQVAATLEATQIPVMVTGSLVSSLQGEPRASHDIDLVIQITADQVEPLLDAFGPPDFYLSRSAVMDAIARKKMFNLLDLRSGDKVDFWILTQDPFDHSRFSRKQRRVVEGTHIDVSSPEDTILAKLRWCQMSGGSEKQYQDALRVFELQFTLLDQNYLNQWAIALSVEPLLNRLRFESEPLH